jgi:ABC-2 type transport system ATP-binding protein
MTSLDRVSSTAASPATLVDVENLAFSYGPVRAIDGITLSVARGQMFGLIGPDGAGKTTTLRLVLGLLKPSGGAVRTCGCEPLRDHTALASRVGYLSQRFSLYGDLTIDENVAFFAEVHGVRGWQPRRDELLAMLRLKEFRHRLAERLSGGMKQKLALACTLIHTPELLVLDEPTTGLDPVSRRDFWKLLVGLQRDGLTILLTTPYMDEAERCQRVALLDHGRLLAQGPPAELRGAAPSLEDVFIAAVEAADRATAAAGAGNGAEATAGVSSAGGTTGTRGAAAGRAR